MHLTIRADGGPDIGFGHLVRTGALARRALQAGDRVTYATRTPAHARTACPDGVEIRPLASDAEFATLLVDARPDAVLTDCYDVDTRCQRALSDRTSRLAVVQDDARHAVCADALINGNVTAPGLDYEWVGSEPTWCLGTDYLLLREGVRERLSADPARRSPAERALITMGGSDVRGTTPEVVRAFDGTDLQVDVIVGPGFENGPEIARAVAETDGSFEVLRDPEDLVDRMFRADMAVSATGTTVYELLALGTPTVGIPQADNQEPIAAALQDREAIVLPDSKRGLRSAIDDLAASADRRRALSEKGRELIDGHGCDRVYEVVVGGAS